MTKQNKAELEEKLIKDITLAVSEIKVGVNSPAYDHTMSEIARNLMNLLKELKELAKPGGNTRK